MLVLKDLVVFIESFNFCLFSITGRGIDLDYYDIERFALETNREGFCFLCRGTFCLCPLWLSMYQPCSEDPVSCPGCLTVDKRLNLLSKSGYQFVAFSCRKYELFVQKLLWISKWLLSSVQFSHSVMSNSLQPHESQHARPPCPSLSPGVHVHWVGDAIQPSYPLSSPFPPASNPSQHQGLFQWVNSLHEVAKVLEFQL